MKSTRQETFMRDERPWILRGKEDDSNKGNDHGGGGQGEGDDSDHSDSQPSAISHGAPQ
ncbi:hypothetical protein [Streptomyces daliensis]